MIAKTRGIWPPRCDKQDCDEPRASGGCGFCARHFVWYQEQRDRADRGRD